MRERVTNPFPSTCVVQLVDRKGIDDLVESGPKRVPRRLRRLCINEERTLVPRDEDLSGPADDADSDRIDDLESSDLVR